MLVRADLHCTAAVSSVTLGDRNQELAAATLGEGNSDHDPHCARPARSVYDALADAC